MRTGGTCRRSPARSSPTWARPAAGPRIKELVGGARPSVYVSPYRRTLHTLALLGLDPAWTVQEPRLREQDWGNLQDADRQRRHREERDFFGHFFYRLPNGESGA